MDFILKLSVVASYDLAGSELTFVQVNPCVVMDCQERGYYEHASCMPLSEFVRLSFVFHV